MGAARREGQGREAGAVGAAARRAVGVPGAVVHHEGQLGKARVGRGLVE